MTVKVGLCLIMLIPDWSSRIETNHKSKKDLLLGHALSFDLGTVVII